MGSLYFLELHFFYSYFIKGFAEVSLAGMGNVANCPGFGSGLMDG